MLTLLGYGRKPVRLIESKVVSGRYNHKLSINDWKKIPEWLENPALVFDSETVDGRLVFIAPESKNNDLIKIIVDPNEEGYIDAHLLINAYDAETKRTPVQRWLKEGFLRYADKQKSLD